MTCSRVERSSGSPPRLPKSLTVRVFWVVDMLDLLSGSVLLMTAGPGPEGEKAGLSRPRAARPEGLALRPGRPRVQRPDVCAAPNPERRDGRARLRGTRRRDLGLRPNDKRFERRTAIAEAVDGHFGCPRRLVAGRQFPGETT